MVLALSSVTVLAIFLYCVVQSGRKAWREHSIEKLVKNDLIMSSLEVRQKTSEGIYELGLLLTGALWALLIAKKDETGIVLSDRPEMIAFVCTSLLLIISSISHYLYLEALSVSYFNGGKIFEDGGTLPNLFDPKFESLYICQIWSLACGALFAVLTILSAHWLKEPEQEQRKHS